MSALAPGFDPLIAEAKLRMRRRRVLMAVLVILGGAGVLFLIFRPSGAPETSRVTPHGRNGNGNGSALAHLKVPLDATERKWRAGLKSVNWGCACGLTAKGAIQVRRRVFSAADKSGATVVRITVWPHGSVEVVLATRTSPAQYLAHRAERFVRLFSRDLPYVKVVNGRGSRIYEWYRLPHEGGVWMPRRLTLCGPIIVSAPISTRPCPVK